MLFYSESSVRKVLKCRNCLINLDEQKPPRILPCGKTICNSCNQKSLNQANFKCAICPAHHSTDQNGFIINDVLLNLVNQQPKLVWRENIDKNVEKFYKHSIVISLLKCQKCNEQSYEYEEARVLPCCGKTVCKLCLDKVLTKVSAKNFNCEICLKMASFPENGFPINEIISELTDIHPEVINRGANAENLILNLKNAELLLNKLKFDSEHIDVVLDDHCTEQKRLIQLAIEENEMNTKNKVKEKLSLNEILIKEVACYEEKCKIKYSSKTQLKQKTKSLIEQTMQMLAFWKVFLEEYHIYEAELKSLNKLTQNLMHELYRELKNVKREIFDNKLIQFNRIKLCIQYEPVEYKFLTGSYDSTVKLWNYESGECEKTFEGHEWEVNNLERYGEEKFVSGSFDGTINVWNIETGQCLLTIKAYDHAESLCLFGTTRHRDNMRLEKVVLDCIEVLENDRLVTIKAENDTAMKIWDLKTGKCIKEFPSMKLVTLHLYHKVSGVKIWDVNTEKYLKFFKAYDIVQSLLKISKKIIAAGLNDGEIVIWCVDTGTELMNIQAHYKQIWQLDNLWENTIISASKDTELKVWDIITGQCLKTFKGHKHDVWRVCVLK